MGKIFDELNSDLCDFISRQKMFFVGSAPVDTEGMVNISPKGSDSFRILNSKTVAYLDLTGSGIESVAHIKENGRFVIMFCSFDQSPKIVRLHGKAVVFERNSVEWDSLQDQFKVPLIGRAIIQLAINRVSDSCGWGVPMYEYMGDRELFGKYERQVDTEKLRQSQLENNMQSNDGLPGLQRPSF